MAQGVDLMRIEEEDIFIRRDLDGTNLTVRIVKKGEPKMTEAVNKLIKGSFVPALNARIDLELVDRAEAEVERFV